MLVVDAGIGHFAEQKATAGAYVAKGKIKLYGAFVHTPATAAATAAGSGSARTWSSRAAETKSTLCISTFAWADCVICKRCNETSWSQEGDLVPLGEVSIAYRRRCGVKMLARCAEQATHEHLELMPRETYSSIDVNTNH